MRLKLRQISVLYAAGCVGGLAHILMISGFETYGISSVLDVTVPSPWASSVFYPRIVWGGLWAFLFLRPFFPGSIFQRGVLLSFIPSAFELLLLLPFFEDAGILGWERGVWTPLVIVVANIMWGLATAFHLCLVRNR